MSPAALQVTNPINLVFSSPSIPATLVFNAGASVRQFIGGGGTSVSLQSNAQDLSALNSVSSVQEGAPGATDGSRVFIPEEFGEEDDERKKKGRRPTR